jgi:hypothetical protein
VKFSRFPIVCLSDILSAISNRLILDISFFWLRKVEAQSVDDHLPAFFLLLRRRFRNIEDNPSII